MPHHPDQDNNDTPAKPPLSRRTKTIIAVAVVILLAVIIAVNVAGFRGP